MAISDTFKNTFNNLPSQQTATPAPFDVEAFKAQLAGGAKSTRPSAEVNNAIGPVQQTIPQVKQQAPLPVDAVGKARADLQKAQGMLDDMNQVSTNSVSEANSISGRPDEVIPTPEETPEPTSFRDQASSFLTGKLDGSDKASRADARAIKAEELQLQAKATESNAVLNEIRTARLDFEDQIERLDRNTGGRSRIANTGRKNELTREYNRNAARQSLRYNVLQGRTTEAQNTIDTYMKDIAADQANQLSIFKTLMDFAQNDMTESEKLQAQQAFSEKQSAQDFQNQKDLALFKASLTGGGDDLQRRAQLITLAKAGDQQSILELGYDPNNSPLTGDKILQIEKTDKQLNDDLGLIQGLGANKRAIEASTGIAKGGFFTSVFETGTGSKVIEPIKEDFLNSIKKLTGAYTLDNLIEKKSQGATFGALSNAELGIISSSASDLNALLDIDPESGEIVGLTGTEDALRGALKSFEVQVLDAIDLNNSKLGLVESEIQEINNI